MRLMGKEDWRHMLEQVGTCSGKTDGDEDAPFGLFLCIWRRVKSEDASGVERRKPAVVVWRESGLNRNGERSYAAVAGIGPYRSRIQKAYRV
jgi:hypothetical protein